MSDATLGAIVSIALGVIGSGGLVALVKLIYDIITGRAAEQRKNNRDARADADVERELRIAHQTRAAELELLALSKGAKRDEIPAPVDMSRLYRSDP